MSLDPTNVEEGHYLIKRLSEYNPWWGQGSGAAVTDEYTALRDEFYDLHRALVTDDRPVFGVSGPDQVGKTALLLQLISALIDPDFIEKFYRQPGFRSDARDEIVPPENILYIPFSASPLIQIRVPEQLTAAVSHFETHYQHGSPKQEPKYIILDDVDRITPSRKNQPIDWAQTLGKLSREDPSRRFILTTISESRLKPVLREAGVTGHATENELECEKIRPLKFSDFARFRFRELETTDPRNRFSAARAQSALNQAVREGSAELLVDELNSELQKAVVPGVDIRRELSNYLTVGGNIGLRLAAADVLSGEQLTNVLRGRAKPNIHTIQQETLTVFRRMLRERGPELAAVEKPGGLERICALIAAENPTTSIRFQTLTSLLDIDRRTLRRKYFGVLSQLFALSPSPEYNNLRPRLVRAYLRDPGIANAFMDRDLNDVLGASATVEAALLKSVLFDHIIRLSELVNDARDPKRGVVKFWSGSEGEVDFIMKLDGRPIPIVWSRHSTITDVRTRGTSSSGVSALKELLSSTAPESEQDPLTRPLEEISTDVIEQRRDFVKSKKYYGTIDGEVVFDGEPPFGIILTNDSRNTTPRVTLINQEGWEKPVVEIPQWVILRLV